jgi:hypothetical protein
MAALTRILTAIWLATFACAKSPGLETDLALLGPIYLPVNDSSNALLASAKQQALRAIQEAILTGNSTFGPFDNETTSFAASVFSLTTGESLLDFNFEAPGLNGSLSEYHLTEDTIFRTGSLGKLLTVYTWLVDIGDALYLDPVAKYIVSCLQYFKIQR